MDEEVDILLPPMFEKSGATKTRDQAYDAGDWVGTFNLWIVTNHPEPSIIYQQRSPKKKWAPGLLDVTAGGHYTAGEQLTDGLREVEEELGKLHKPEDVLRLGKRLFVGRDTQGRTMNNVVELYLIEDDSPMGSYKLDSEEVYALCVCPVSELLRAHHDNKYTFTAQGLTAEGKAIAIEVDRSSFPENWDDYHHKIALLADSYFRGVKGLVY